MQILAFWYAPQSPSSTAAYKRYQIDILVYGADGTDDAADVELNELPTLQRTGWVDITHARQYQQETYTSLLRMRRGPGRIAR